MRLQVKDLAGAIENILTPLTRAKYMEFVTVDLAKIREAEEAIVRIQRTPLLKPYNSLVRTCAIASLMVIPFIEVAPIFSPVSARYLYHFF